MKKAKKILVLALKKTDIASAIAVRLTKVTGKSKVPIHPKHLLEKKPWFTGLITKKDKVLDLGSGNGQNTIKTAFVAKEVTGVEINETLIDQAKESVDLKGLKNAKFKIGNLEKKLNLPDKHFDKVIFLDVLEHIKKRDQILNEIRRILKPDGLLFVGVPNSQTSWKKFQKSAGVCSFSDPDHKIEFSEKSIRHLLEKHKFKIISFGYGKFDIPARGVVDIIGGLSTSLYKKITDVRTSAAQKNPLEASGFEIVAQK